MAKKQIEEKINLDSILFKCRDILRQARNSGSFFEKRDMMLTLVFLRFIGEKFEDGVERLRLDFTLPHSANIRRALTASELRKLREGKAVYFSQELCARYFTYRRGSENHYVLFDDAQTLRAKAAAAENRGVREGFFMLPEVADIAGELLGQA